MRFGKDDFTGGGGNFIRGAGPYIIECVGISKDDKGAVQSATFPADALYEAKLHTMAINGKRNIYEQLPNGEYTYALNISVRPIAADADIMLGLYGIATLMREVSKKGGMASAASPRHVTKNRALVQAMGRRGGAAPRKVRHWLKPKRPA